MSNFDLVTFKRLDYSISSHIEEVTKEFADHFKIRRVYVPQFCSLIKTSKRWNMSNLKDKLDSWVEKIGKIKGTAKLINITKRAFESCNDDVEIHDLRGAMVEALVIGAFGGSVNLEKSNYGWGARVDINISNKAVKKITYSCKIKVGVECTNRSTIDFGHWDGFHGKFYECKVQPRGIECKEVSYMRNLKDELTKLDISHELFFVCAEASEAIQMKLADYDLGPLFKVIGVRELASMPVG